jgi:hypothetical protein
MTVCALCQSSGPTSRVSGLDLCDACTLQDPGEALLRLGIASSFKAWGMRISAELFVPGMPEGFKLSAGPERLHHALIKLFSTEVEVGDPIFDDRVFLRTNDPERASLILRNEGVQSAVLALLSDLRQDDMLFNHVTLEGTSLRVSVSPMRGLADDVLQSLTLEIAALAVHLLRDQDVRR